MDSANDHRSRMDEFWARLAEVQARIDRAKRLYVEFNRTAMLVAAEVEEHRRLLHEEFERKRLLK